MPFWRNQVHITGQSPQKCKTKQDKTIVLKLARDLTWVTVIWENSFTCPRDFLSISRWRAICRGIILQHKNRRGLTEKYELAASPLIAVSKGGSRKFRKRGPSCPTPHPPEWKLHFSGHAVYSIVGVFVMQKVWLTFQKHLKMQGKRGVCGPPALP